jgi:apolipoprotein N-acyltransferase
VISDAISDVTVTRAARPRPEATGVPVLPAAVAAGAALASGVALLLAFPPYDLWWLAPVGVALLAVATSRRRIVAGAGLGGLAGLVYFLPLLSWTGGEIGSVPWLLLSGLQAGYLALLGAAAALLRPVVDRWRWTWPLLTALLWVGQEALRSRTPFGGFPWGRLAFSQGDAPSLRLAALGGAPLVTFAVALAGGLLAAAVVAAVTGHRGRELRPGRAGAAALAGAGGLGMVAGAVLLVGLAVPPHTPAGQQVTVAIVQGNVPRLGLDFNAQRRAVLENHVEATIRLAGEVDGGRQPPPDLVIWPENASDIDPLANPDAGRLIDGAAQAIGAPILVGAILRGPDPGDVRNVGLVWRPDTGPGEVYTKRHPVPFAEYLPLEPVVYPVARAITDAVDRVAGFRPGDEPGVLRLGPATVGDVICFEVAYDAIVRDTVTGGAELLAVQTNNATFNEAEARQQLAMVRLRAVEHGRWSLMASTVGVSGFVAPDGEVYNPTGFFTRDVVVRTLALSGSRTVATAAAGWPEAVLVTGASTALLLAAHLRRRGVAGVADTGSESPEQS